jgi:hypothetical protein
VLALLDLQQPLAIKIIASQYGIGVVLKRGGNLGAYHLETLSLAKLNYNIYDR